MTGRSDSTLELLASNNPVPVESLGDSWNTPEGRRLLNEIVVRHRAAAGTPGEEPSWDNVMRNGFRPSRRTRRLTAVALVACAAIVAGALVTRSQPSGPASKWQLVSAVGLPFRSLPAGAQYNLWCVSDEVCYSYGGPTSSDHPWGLYRTIDGGRTWTKSPVPLAAGASVFLLSCPGTQTCAVLSQASTTSSGRSTELAITTDGGTLWKMRVVPAPSGSSGTVANFACADNEHCVVGVFGGAFLSTSDGGERWTQASDVPAIAGQLWTMVCSSDGSCLAVFFTGGTGSFARSVTALRSSDWGVTWSAGTSVSVPQLGPVVHSSCSSALQCMLVSVGGPPARPFEIITTDNGGASWQVSGPPKGWSNMPTAVACATPTDCWIAMSTYDATSPKGAYSNPVVEMTVDGGATWVASTLPTTTPPLADVNTLSCPPSGRGCMGIGTGRDHFVLPSDRSAPLSPPLVISDLPTS